MQVLILAAGISKRLLPLTARKPKTLIKLQNQEILGYIFDWCIACAIKKFNIVTGHGEDYIKEFVKEYQKKFSTHSTGSGQTGSNNNFQYASSDPELVEGESRSNTRDLTFNFIYNPKYNEWGNIYSMYVAKDVFSEDFILINSDVIFKKEILRELLNSSHQNAMLIDDYKTLGEEEMKVYVDSQERIKKIHKKLDPKKSQGEYIGILKISASIKNQLILALERQLKIDNSVYYEDALQILMNENVPIYKVSTKGLPCMEIDTHEDLEKAKELIKKCK
jgi:choline kinase